MITIEDIRNPKRKSGFDHVYSAGGMSGRPNSNGKPWMAVMGWVRNQSGRGTKPTVRGERRSTPKEAAQDYCDYINGQQVQHVILPSYDAPEIDMGTTTVRVPDDLKPQPVKPALRRKAYDGPHDLYDVVLYDHITKIIFRRKVGITAVADRRYADMLKTWGLSVKALRPAALYPSKASAEAAEIRAIAEIAEAANDWERCGKEAFRPTRVMTLADLEMPEPERTLISV